MIAFLQAPLKGKTGGLQPLLVARLLQLRALMESRGIGFSIVSGLRSLAKQQALYDAWKSGQSKLPAANPNQCRHCKGIAADVQLYNLATGAPYGTWSADTPWALFGENAEKVGLVWGGRWGEWGVQSSKWDPVHVELKT